MQYYQGSYEPDERPTGVTLLDSLNKIISSVKQEVDAVNSIKESNFKAKIFDLERQVRELREIVELIPGVVVGGEHPAPFYEAQQQIDWQTKAQVWIENRINAGKDETKCYHSKST